MITVIYSTHKDEHYNNNFKKHLLQSVGLNNIQVLEYQNNNQYSLSEIYNKGISESKFDIIVCCHNDIKLENGWGVKLLNDFNDNPDFAIIGKAGSCYFPESGVYWEKMFQTMVGQVYHHPEGSKKWLSKYSEKLPFLIPVVTIDGLFISFDKTKIKHKFDETIGKFHFYDHLFCLPNYLNGVKIGVTSSFEITHKSVGAPNQEFYESKDKFLEKFSTHLPLDLKPITPYIPKLNKKDLKKLGKVAVIIPTKSNIDLLFNCISSFEKNCDSYFYDIFIADTGSSETEKNDIKNFINEKVNVTFIEYDYYNFGKINNDVVKNYASNKYEFLLFCNNDIVLLNDVISEMLYVFKNKQNSGTVGARLHFNDNTIQHCGIIAGIDSKNSFQVTHIGLTNYYNYTTTTTEVFGNTAALLMIRKNVFEKCGCFNENYTDCFEDVELNINCLSLGLTNYFVGSAVAYHLESQTRNSDPNKIQKLLYDYNNSLVPCVAQNFNKIKKHLIKFN
jgi:GT2 family glycosyltransferase